MDVRVTLFMGFIMNNQQFPFVTRSSLEPQFETDDNEQECEKIIIFYFFKFRKLNFQSPRFFQRENHRVYYIKKI